MSRRGEARGCCEKLSLKTKDEHGERLGGLVSETGVKWTLSQELGFQPGSIRLLHSRRGRPSKE